jgi:hypothetical protein
MEKEQNWRPAALALTVLGVVARLLPHPPNFSPVGSASLFSGARLSGWKAYLIPLIIMVVTDPILAVMKYHVAPYTSYQVFIYLSFMLSVAIGRFLGATQSVPRIALASLLNSTQFFLISNFAVWVGSTEFAHTAAGLAACYVVAIPFFAYTAFGDLFFAGAIFGLYAWLSRTHKARQLMWDRL